MEPGAIGALTLSGELKYSTIINNLLLYSSNDPIESILNIQKQLLVEDGKIEAVFQLLDKCGVSRAEVYSRILNNLTNSLKDQINWKNYFNTEILFKEMLPYNRFSEVRDILSKLIKESPKLSSELILAIGKYPNLIDVCPLAVRQEIWENKEDYLIEKVNEEIDNHFKDISVGLEITVSVYDDTKLIMPCRIANKLKEYSDGHPKLVKTILKCIRTKFVETEDTRCCLLYRDYIRNLNCEDYIYAVKLISLINNLKDCMNKNTLIPEKIEEIMKQIEPYTEYITPEEFAKSLFDYIEKLIEHDKSNFFLYPVTELICKGYRKEIREPMDYHTLESKLLINKYNTFEDFKHDLDLIYSNSRRYNARIPDLFTYTCREEDFAKTELDKIKKAKDPSYLVDMIMIIMCPYYINMIINYLILYLNAKTKEVNYDINSDNNIDCANYLLLFQSIWKPIISASIIDSVSHDYSEYIKILSTKDYQFYDAFRLQIRGYIVDDLTSDHEQIVYILLQICFYFIYRLLMLYLLQYI